jgi:N-acetylmuramoyl-L-alanine amidase
MRSFVSRLDRLDRWQMKVSPGQDGSPARSAGKRYRHLARRSHVLVGLGRSLASILVAIAIVLAAAATPVTGAEPSSPRTLYTDVLLQERALRQEIEKRKSDAQAPVLLKRVRSLVEAYARMSRQYPTGAHMDNALWQAAVLSADAFWAFGEPDDRATALELFSELGERFPRSSRVQESPSHVKRLRAAKTAPRAAPPRTTAIASTSTTTELTSVKREVLPDALRITIALGQEVTFHADRLDGPARVFIDLENTRPVAAIRDTTIPFDDDVVRKVRIGRQTEAKTRVVMDLSGAGRHSIYSLYNPYRVVIDFARAPGVQAAAVTPAATVPTSAVRQAAVTTNIAAPVPTPGPLPAASASATPAAPVALGGELSPPVAAGASAPASPTLNGSGGFSLSRQLGLRVSRVVIDPGHGGHDPGAKTKGLTEADLVLDVALRLEQLLSKQDGFEVVLTRRVDTFVPLEERTAIANREGADLFLSIHANASTNGAARGVETYFLNLTGNPDAEAVAARENAGSSRSMSQLPDIVKAIALNNKIQESRDFASMIQASMSSQLRKADSSVRNLGVKQAPFLVLLGASMPSVLAEISFITNKQEAAMLKSEKGRQRIAEALFAGVLRYQQSLKGGPQIAEQ